MLAWRQTALSLGDNGETRGGGSRTPRPSPRTMAQTDRAEQLFDAIEPGSLANKLLAALPLEDFELLRPHVTTVGLAQATVVSEVGDEVDQIYFPLSGMVSLVAS